MGAAQESGVGAVFFACIAEKSVLARAVLSSPCMRHAQTLLMAAGGMMLAAAAAMACSMEADSAFDNGARAPNCASDDTDCKSKGSNPDGGELDGNDAKGAPGAPTSDGILIVHAAAFPSFRLCFENALDQVPQPDTTVMPEANVVGVEQGGIVRINGIDTAPGRVIVVRERDVRPAPGEKQSKCSSFFSKKEDGTIKAPTLVNGTTSYLITDALTEPVGTKSAELLVIYGCGTQNTLNILDQVDSPMAASSASCGEGWSGDTGNLHAKTLALQTVAQRPTDQQIPVQLVNVAPAIKALNGTVTVSFGETGKREQPLDLPAAPFNLGTPHTLDVNQNELTTYATQGFDVSVKIGKDTVTASQTLADVQSASSPNDTPSHYYRAASNYALLLLGDPSHKPKLANDEDNPAYDPRRALHILAVPVIDPAKVADAGADASNEAETP